MASSEAHDYLNDMRAFVVKVSPRLSMICNPHAPLRHNARVFLRWKEGEPGQLPSRGMWAIVLTKRPRPFRRVRVQFVHAIDETEASNGETYGRRMWLGPCDDDWEIAPVVGESRCFRRIDR